MMTDTLHRTIVTQHKTMRWQTQYGSVSIRKQRDRYHVYCEEYETNKQIRADFATLRGAQIMAEELRRNYL